MNKQLNNVGNIYLSQILNQEHPLYKLANNINWNIFYKIFQLKIYVNNDDLINSRLLRVMTGLIILKHIRNISSHSVISQWQENPYFQYFCGSLIFSDKSPCTELELEQFSNTMREVDIELLLQQSIS